MIVRPAPDIAPPDQVKSPVTEIFPVPLSVPPLKFTAAPADNVVTPLKMAAPPLIVSCEPPVKQLLNVAVPPENVDPAIFTGAAVVKLPAATSKSPAPLISDVAARECVPLKRSVAPPAIAKSPVCVPPLSQANVPP